VRAEPLNETTILTLFKYESRPLAAKTKMGGNKISFPKASFQEYFSHLFLYWGGWNLSQRELLVHPIYS